MKLHSLLLVACHSNETPNHNNQSKEKAQGELVAERETDRDRQRQTDRQTDRETERQRDRERDPFINFTAAHDTQRCCFPTRALHCALPLSLLSFFLSFSPAFDRSWMCGPAAVSHFSSMHFPLVRLSTLLPSLSSPFFSPFHLLSPSSLSPPSSLTPPSLS